MSSTASPAVNPPGEPSQVPPPGRGMYLSELRLENFRSCYETVVPLREDVTVLVGENNSGKSNVIEALRLAISPMGGRRTRYFEPADLSFGREDCVANISMRFDGLTEIQRGQYLTALDVTAMAAIYGTRFELDPDRPSRSRPINTSGPGRGPDPEPAKRDEICHVYLEPLRDAQRDLDSSGSRRLATIVEDLHAPADVAAFVGDANSQLREIEEHEIVKTTATTIAGYLSGLTDPVRSQQMGLLFRDYKLHRLAAALRVKLSEAGIDLADIADSGLGYANLLFIATVLLQLRAATEAELTLLLVEEPEAHLHPQLQSVLLDFLHEQAAASVRDDTTGPAGRIQVIVTTHSPVIASSVPVSNVVVLRSTKVEIPASEADNPADADEPAVHSATVAVAVAELGLDAGETRKVDQYLDATKASLLFGTRVILVEGISEAVLLPVLGRRLYPDDDDSRARRRALAGLTIVTLGSVDFEPYVRLLLGRSPAGNSILDRLVVITDTDPEVPDEDEEDDDQELVDQPIPPPRVARLLAMAGDDPRLRVFTAARTLEADLLGESENTPILGAVFLAQKPRSNSRWKAFVEADDPAAALYQRLRSTAGFIAKGQFAHDLALRIEDGEEFKCPSYLADAIETALGQ
ncbi:MAG: AAA family ATPase [Dehalococcoidia bacterium]|nr:AAA family ATPase [Dehalococcoidia bacterium]